MEVCICVVFIVVLLSSPLFLTKRQKATLAEFPCISHLSCYRTKLGSTCPHVVKPTYQHHCSEGECRVYCRCQARSPRSSCSKDSSSPMGFRERVLKAKEGEGHMVDDQFMHNAVIGWWWGNRAVTGVNIFTPQALAGLGPLCSWSSCS